VLKMRALTEQAYIDDAENEEDGIAETLMDDEAVAQIGKPGTSLRTGMKTSGGPTQGMRPPSTSGRPLTGVVRPASRSRPETMEQALKTPRTARSSRPLTSSSGMRARLGTASMVSEPGGPFIILTRLNMAKYATQQSIAKPLFEYIYHHEQDVPKVGQLSIMPSGCSYV
jgi:tetratricopeptide repeat protein 8